MGLKELLAKKAELAEKRAAQKAKYEALTAAAIDGGLTDEDRTQLEAIKAETANINKRIAEIDELVAEQQALIEQERNAPNAMVISESALNAAQVKDPQIFKSFGEQMQAIRTAYQTKMKEVDPRLLEVERQAAAAGGVAAIGADGGFLIQSDFQTDIMKRAYDLGNVLSRCRRARLSSNSDKLVIPFIDETSRATGSRWGGVQVYWANEADTATAKKPKIGKMEVELSKLIGIAYMTRELLEDASAIDSVYRDAFAEEITFMLENAIMDGTGAGQPLGIFRADAFISVAKETGQAAATILYENALNILSRMWQRSTSNAVFTINPDIIPQLGQMNMLTGTSGTPVFLPPGNTAANAPYGTLFGRPLVTTEYNKTLGTVGDIALIDFSQYLVLDKGELRVDMSEHVNFTSDEVAMRFVLRVGGRPLWHSALTPLNGTATKSPYVGLATRA